MTDRYPTPEYRRTALAPGVLAAIVALAGIALIGTDGFTVIRFAVSILALIIAVFAWQARQWWWTVALAVIAVMFNPVVPIDVGPDVLLALHFAAAAVFTVAALTIRARNTEDRNKR
ncbi:MAG: DUF6804 family protein [Microbacteriaceae bacterium]